jgi:hypothetical protein
VMAAQDYGSDVLQIEESRYNQKTMQLLTSLSV